MLIRRRSLLRSQSVNGKPEAYRHVLRQSRAARHAPISLESLNLSQVTLVNLRPSPRIHYSDNNPVFRKHYQPSPPNLDTLFPP